MRVHERVAFQRMSQDVSIEYASLARTKFRLQQRKTSLRLAYIEILWHFPIQINAFYF